MIHFLAHSSRQCQQKIKFLSSVLLKKKKLLRNGDYLAVVAFCFHSILLTNYTSGGLVGAPWYYIDRMKDLQLCFHVVADTINSEI